SRTMLARLEERLRVHPDNVFPVKGFLDLADVGQLYMLDRPDLKYAPWLPYTQRRLGAPADGDVFGEIAQRDIVVQHPYAALQARLDTPLKVVRGGLRDGAIGEL